MTAHWIGIADDITSAEVVGAAYCPPAGPAPPPPPAYPSPPRYGALKAFFLVACIAGAALTSPGQQLVKVTVAAILGTDVKPRTAESPHAARDIAPSAATPSSGVAPTIADPPPAAKTTAKARAAAKPSAPGATDNRAAGEAAPRSGAAPSDDSGADIDIERLRTLTGRH